MKGLVAAWFIIEQLASHLIGLGYYLWMRHLDTIFANHIKQ